MMHHHRAAPNLPNLSDLHINLYIIAKMYCLAVLAGLLIAQPLVLAQLTGSVGPTTNAIHKADVMTCDITDYGATSSTDVGAAFLAAWSACSGGGLVYIPPGKWPLRSLVSVKSTDGMAVQWDGLIYRDADLSGNMFTFRNLKNFELFSGNSEGAFQGYGYEYLENGDYGARMFRFEDMTDFSMHGLTLVDSPAYYVAVLTSSNVEVYNMLLHGSTTLGATDGFDISGDNMWFHDIQVTNGDECVTVKSPSSNLLIESIYCNYSGGMAIGSLGLGTAVENVEYNHLYMHEADGCFVKTHNGDGYVKTVSWTNVIVAGGAYILAIDANWGADLGSTGVEISDLTWKVCQVARFHVRLYLTEYMLICALLRTGLATTRIMAAQPFALSAIQMSHAQI
jgi:rhamnogalacturonan hydrolase